MSYKWFEECNYGQKDAIDQRWDDWVNSSHELWMEKNEEEQRSDIEVRWKYLKDLLNRRGIETSHHRLLFSMIENEFGILELRIGSPDRGLVSVNRLELDRGCYTLHTLPRQTVNEIDGRIAVLDPYGSLWKIHEEADGNIMWDKETIDIMPIHWNGEPELSIEALTGTNLIFLQSEWSDSLVYYNRDNKKAIRFPIFPESNSIDWKRIIQV
ncbi:hypothetical protein MKX03_028757 [Papaver bracteatum]|nr:hypothetical protein MKX03_028757 [Papaver bracteatum]